MSHPEPTGQSAPSATPADRLPAASAAPGSGSLTGLNVLRDLDTDGRRAFVAASSGWALDAYDYQIFPLSLVAIMVTFHLSTSEAGWISTTGLVVSAFGGILAGVLADRIGRVRTLMLAIGTYALFTFLCGFAPNYPSLLVLRGLEGLGFGGEWAAGAILMAEYAAPRTRGRLLGMIQSSWAIGWSVAVIAYTIVFAVQPAEQAWRTLFWIGVLPALLVLYIRGRVPDPQVYVATRRVVTRERHLPPSLVQIFRPDLIRTTVVASLLATGVQGGYYSVITWLPAYLKEDRHLSVISTAGYLGMLIGGSFLGYLLAGYVADRLGRRPTFALFAIGSGLLVVLYARLPLSANAVLFVLGFPLGFFASGIFSGFGSYLAELYPSRARGAGQGFCYNVGRGIGAFFPVTVGYLATSLGTGGAIAFGAVGYLLALAALAALPETRGLTLRTVD